MLLEIGHISFRSGDEHIFTVERSMSRLFRHCGIHTE